MNIDGKDDDTQILKGGKVIMYKPNSKGRRADEGEELTPEEMEAAIALFKAQKAANQATGEGVDGEDPEETPAANPEEKMENRKRHPLKRLRRILTAEMLRVMVCRQRILLQSRKQTLILSYRRLTRCRLRAI